MHLPDYSTVMGLSEKRGIEKGGTLFLLEKLMAKPVNLCYTTEGKPYLENESSHISISHSHNKLVIVLNSESETGVDIELIRDKVLKIKHKFLTAAELIDAGEDVEKLIIYWACKEALYKLYGKKEVDFIAHLYIHPFEKNASGSLTGEINLTSFRKKIKLHYEKIEDYMLVYTLNEIK
jgi:phosphopantetheinyl transferase